MIIVLISLSLYESSGMTITQKISSTFRVVIEIVKVLFVWIYEVIYYDLKKDAHPESNYLLILFLKLFGYLFIIFGNILINEIFVVRFCGLDRFYGKRHHFFCSFN